MLLTFDYISDVCLLCSSNPCIGALLGIAHTLAPSLSNRFGTYLHQFTPWAISLSILFYNLLKQFKIFSIFDKSKETRYEKDFDCYYSQQLKFTEIRLNEIFNFFSSSWDVTPLFDEQNMCKGGSFVMKRYLEEMKKNNIDDSNTNDGDNNNISRKNNKLKYEIKTFLNLIHRNQLSSQDNKIVEDKIRTDVSTSVMPINSLPYRFLRNIVIQTTSRKLGIFRAMQLSSLNLTNLKYLKIKIDTGQLVTNGRDRNLLSSTTLNGTELLPLEIINEAVGLNPTLNVDVNYLNPFQLFGLFSINTETNNIIMMLHGFEKIFESNEEEKLKSEKDINSDKTEIYPLSDAIPSEFQEYENSIHNWISEQIESQHHDQKLKVENENENENDILYYQQITSKNAKLLNKTFSTKMLFADNCTVLTQLTERTDLKENSLSSDNFTDFEILFLRTLRHNWRIFFRISSPKSKYKMMSNIDADAVDKNDNDNYKNDNDDDDDSNGKNNDNNNDNNDDNDSYDNNDNNNTNINKIISTPQKFEIIDKINRAHIALQTMTSITSAGLSEFDYQGGWKTGSSGGGITLESRLSSKIDSVKVLIRELSLNWFMNILDTEENQTPSTILFQGTLPAHFDNENDNDYLYNDDDGGDNRHD